MRFPQFSDLSFKCRFGMWVYGILGIFLLVSASLFMEAPVSWALQRHTLLPGQTEGMHTAPAEHKAPAETGIRATAPGVAQHGQESARSETPSGHISHTPSTPRSHAASTASTAHQPAKSEAHLAGGTKPPSHGAAVEGGQNVEGVAGGEALPEHGAEQAVHEEHGVQLPKISPTPGVSFVETMIKLMDHELNGRTLGWRPNDIVIGRVTDNINNYQLGVLEAMRFTTLRLKDSLTRMGDADAYDPDLEAALNLFMNRATLFWFPSAENSYQEAVDHLKKFLVKLETGQRHFYYRSDNLLLLLSTYRDLLGNVNRNLIRSDVGFFKSDDYFYYAKGVAHVYYEILKVVRVGFQSQLATTLDATDMMDEILHELHRAEQMDPWIVLNSGPNSFLANHRANLNAPLSEVVHLLVVMSQL